MDKAKLYEDLLERLESSLHYLRNEKLPSNYRKPILFLVLKGIKPTKSCRIVEKELTNRIVQDIPVIDVQIYQKFNEPLISIEKYF